MQNFSRMSSWLCDLTVIFRVIYFAMFATHLFDFPFLRRFLGEASSEPLDNGYFYQRLTVPKKIEKFKYLPWRFLHFHTCVETYNSIIVSSHLNLGRPFKMDQLTSQGGSIGLINLLTLCASLFYGYSPLCFWWSWRRRAQTSSGTWFLVNATSVSWRPFESTLPSNFEWAQNLHYRFWIYGSLMARSNRIFICRCQGSL